MSITRFKGKEACLPASFLLFFPPFFHSPSFPLASSNHMFIYEEYDARTGRNRLSAELVPPQSPGKEEGCRRKCSSIINSPWRFQCFLSQLHYLKLAWIWPQIENHISCWGLVISSLSPVPASLSLEETQRLIQRIGSALSLSVCLAQPPTSDITLPLPSCHMQSPIHSSLNFPSSQREHSAFISSDKWGRNQSYLSFLDWSM